MILVSLEYLCIYQVHPVVHRYHFVVLYFHQAKQQKKLLIGREFQK
jgi:hypothetical protein